MTVCRFFIKTFKKLTYFHTDLLSGLVSYEIIFAF